MSNDLYLSFPSFFQFVIKDNIILTQYDAVCILLSGKPRDSDNYLDDRTISNYVTGAQPINRKLLLETTNCTIDIIKDRLKKLNIQNIDNSVNACKNLINTVSGLNDDIRNELLSFSNSQNSNIDNNYTLLANTFLVAIKCNKKYINKLKKNVLEHYHDLINNRHETASIEEIKQTEIKEFNNYWDYLYNYFSEDNTIVKTGKVTIDQLIPFSETINKYNQGGLIPIDKEDFWSLFSNSQLLSYALLCGKKQLIMHMISLINFYHTHNVWLYIFGPKSIKLDDIDDICNKIKKQISYDSNIIWGCQISSTDDDRFSLFILFSQT